MVKCFGIYIVDYTIHGVDLNRFQYDVYALMYSELN